MSQSTALAKRSAENALMAPPPRPKRIKRPPKVLSEDEYTAALSHIIARDFFPGLLETETQQDYLDALEAGDEDWMEEAGRRVQEVMTPVAGGGRRGRRGVSMTPARLFGSGSATPVGWRGETPTSTPRRTRGDEGEKTTEQKADLNMGLSAFQAKYTSEDNESFNALLDRQNSKRAEKYGWLWNRNKLPSKRQIAQAAHEQKLLTESQRKDRYDQSLAVVMAERPSENQDDRPAMIDAARITRAPRNGLMFTPEDLDEAHPHLESRARAAEEASRAPLKAVAYSNTRLPLSASAEEEHRGEDTIPPSPSISAIDAAIRGRPHPGLQSSIASSEIGGSETPRVNGYAFVDAEPTASEIDVAEGRKQALTRADHDALLQRLIEGQYGADEEGSIRPTGPNPFNIAPTSRREGLHHAMVEKQSKAKRAPPVAKNNRLEALQQSGKTPTPKFASSPRLSKMKEGGAEGMTPAARALYEKVGGQTPGSQGGLGQSGFGGKQGSMDAWTPTPLRVKKAA